MALDPQARYKNLIVQQGADFAETVLFVRPTGQALIDMSGWQWRGEIRKKRAGLLLAAFSFTAIAPTTGYHGGVMLRVDDVITTAIKSNCIVTDIPNDFRTLPREDLPGSPYWYNVESINSGLVRRQLEGCVLVTGDN